MFLMRRQTLRLLLVLFLHPATFWLAFLEVELSAESYSWHFKELKLSVQCSEHIWQHALAHQGGLSWSPSLWCSGWPATHFYCWCCWGPSPGSADVSALPPAGFSHWCHSTRAALLLSFEPSGSGVVLFSVRSHIINTYADLFMWQVTWMIGVALIADGIIQFAGLHHHCLVSRNKQYVYTLLLDAQTQPSAAARRDGMIQILGRKEKAPRWYTDTGSRLRLPLSCVFDG